MFTLFEKTTAICFQFGPPCVSWTCALHLVCGGFSFDIGDYALRECYTIGSDENKYFASLIRGRWYGGTLVLNNSVLWITGGTNLVAPYKSTEYVYPDGTVTYGPDLPEPMDEHCSVHLNQTHSMFISGEAVHSDEQVMFHSRQKIPKKFTMKNMFVTLSHEKI